MRPATIRPKRSRIEEPFTTQSGKRHRARPGTSGPVHRFSTNVDPCSIRDGCWSLPTKAVQVTSFSLGPAREFIHTDRALRYFDPPPVGTALDLLSGRNTFIKRDESKPEYLDHLLKALKGVEKLPWSNSSADETVDVVTWRGILRRLCGIPYERESFQLLATLYRGTLYLSEGQDGITERQAVQGKSNPRQKDFVYAGYKFEALVTSGTAPSNQTPRADTAERWKQRIETRDRDVVNNNEEWGVVYRTQLGALRLLLGCEVDCSRGPKPSGPNPCEAYVELKTHKLLQNDRDRFSFARYKLLSTYLQCKLASVSDVIFGWRDSHLKVSTWTQYKTDDLPKVCQAFMKGRRDAWDPVLCFRFGEWVLRKIKEALEGLEEEETVGLKFEASEREVCIRKVEGESLLGVWVKEG